MEKPDTDSPRVTVSAAWREEMRRRQDAFAAWRARWVEAWDRGGALEPPTETERAGSRRSRPIYDRRQYRLDI